MDEQPDYSPLRLGESVPRFSARSTQGHVDLANYLGRWVILFCHPGDFTPVCTSEFIALARATDQFVQRDCALLGISVDSLYSHLAWIRQIHDMAGVEISFPLIEDPSMEIARAYGMIGAQAVDAAAVRSTYFIDPQGILRASTTYPATVGRSIPEMLRLLCALQRTESGEALAPADWQVGNDVLCVPGETAQDALRPGDRSSWFYSFKQDSL